MDPKDILPLGKAKVKVDTSYGGDLQRILDYLDYLQMGLTFSFLWIRSDTRG